MDGSNNFFSGDPPDLPGDWLVSLFLQLSEFAENDVERFRVLASFEEDGDKHDA